MSEGTLYIIAGHDIKSDPGAIAYDRTTEASLTLELRDAIVKYIKASQSVAAVVMKGTVYTDPDNDGLLQTINKINSTCVAPEKSFLLDIHFNYNHVTASGAETFYYSKTSETVITWAKELNTKLSKVLGIPDRGVKPDTAANCGRLGILADTKPKALLLEVCFMNTIDLPKYRSNKQQVVEVIGNFLMERLKLLS